MPFTSNLLAHSDLADPSVNALYVGTMLLSSAALLWLGIHLRRHPSLTAAAATNNLRIRETAATVAAFACALVLSVVFPLGGVFWLLLLIPASLVSSRLRRRSSSSHAG